MREICNALKILLQLSRKDYFNFTKSLLQLSWKEWVLSRWVEEKIYQSSYPIVDPAYHNCKLTGFEAHSTECITFLVLPVIEIWARYIQVLGIIFKNATKAWKMQSSKESVLKAKIENRLEHCERAVGCIHEDSQRHDHSFGSFFMTLIKKGVWLQEAEFG